MVQELDEIRSFREKCSAALLHAHTHTHTHTHTRMKTDEPKMEGKMERQTGGEEGRRTDR